MNPIILKEALTNIDTLEKIAGLETVQTLFCVEIARIYSAPEKGLTAAFLKYQPQGRRCHCTCMQAMNTSSF